MVNLAVYVATAGWVCAVVAFKDLSRLGLVGLAIAAVWLCSLYPESAGAQVCPVASQSFVENFDDPNDRDALSTVTGWGSGEIRIASPSGALSSYPTSLRGRILAADTLDFNLDGQADLVAMVEENSKTSSCELFAFLSLGRDGDGTPLGFQDAMTIPGLSLPGCVAEGAFVRTGDLDGDGLVDVVAGYIEDFEGDALLPTNAHGRGLWVFRNVGRIGGVPNFAPEGAQAIGFTQALGWHWRQGALSLVEMNDDSDSVLPTEQRMDLVASINRGSIQEIYGYEACHPLGGSLDCPNTDSFGGLRGFGWNTGSSITGQGVAPPRLLLSRPVTGALADAFSTLQPDDFCNDFADPGLNIVLAADLDRDADLDLILGGMGSSEIEVWLNQGTQHRPIFDSQASETLAIPQGSPTYASIGDFNGDGWVDLVVAADAYSCGSGGGELWISTNRGGRLLSGWRRVADIADDPDWLVTMDADGNGRDDLLVGTGRYFGEPVMVYFDTDSSLVHTEAWAISKPVLDTEASLGGVGIVSAQIDGWIGTDLTAIEIEFSNNDGLTWEKVSADVYPPSSAVHRFRSFGNVFRWRVRLQSNETALSGTGFVYEPAGLQAGSASLQQLQFSVAYAQDVYSLSRSALTAGSVTEFGNPRSYIYGASTQFPNHLATLDAFDITSCTGFSADGLRDQACVNTPWGVGGLKDLLVFFSSALRTIYGVLLDGSEQANQRITMGQGNSLSNSEQAVLGAAAEPDDLKFWRQGLKLNGQGDEHKTYDWGFSSPVFVGMPTGDPEFFDPEGNLDYADFIAAQASRQSTLAIGSNDGAIHAYDARGSAVAELWSVLPRNLGPRLLNQREEDDSYTLSHMVDGPVVVRDVYDGVAWRTIAIASQFRGEGIDGRSYLVGLDITNPANPIPLWEYSDGLGAQQSCDADPCTDICEMECPVQTCQSDCGVLDGTLAGGTVAGFDLIQPSPDIYAAVKVGDRIHLQQNAPSTSQTVEVIEKLDPTVRIHPVLLQTFTAGTRLRLEPRHVFEFVGDQAVMEAEDFGQQSFLDNQHAFLTTSSTFGGESRGHIRALPNTAQNCSPNGFWPPSPTCGALVEYPIRFDFPGTYRVLLRQTTDNQDTQTLVWGIDGVPLQRIEHTTPLLIWQWRASDAGTSANTPASAQTFVIDMPGIHQLLIRSAEDGAPLDRIIVDRVGSGFSPTNTGPAVTCEPSCALQRCDVVCRRECVSNPSVDPWPQCGIGTNQKCCSDGHGAHVCVDVAQDCSEPLGGSGWMVSAPEVGKFLVDGSERWLAIFGGGIASDNNAYVQSSVYALDVLTGQLLGRWDVDDLPASASNPSTLTNQIVGGVALVDTDRCDVSPADAGCGLVDRLYFGDLEGRLWRIDTSSNVSLNGQGQIDSADWSTCLIFDAGDPDGDGQRIWAPISHRPAVSFQRQGFPNLYVGTGAHPEAPTMQYRFYGVRDINESGLCISADRTESDLLFSQGEWIIGDGLLNSSDPITAGASLVNTDDEGVLGERFWASPVVINDAIVVFASSTVDIDAVDPCLVQDSTLYAYALRRFRGTDGRIYRSGEQVGRLTGLTRIRQPALVLGQNDGVGFNIYGNGVQRDRTLSSSEAPRVFVQEGAAVGDTAGQSPAVLEVGGSLGIPGLKTRKPYRILRWREVPL